MARKRHTPEQVVRKLREAEVARAGGSTVAEADRRDRADLLPLAQRLRASQDRPAQAAEAPGVGEQPPEETLRWTTGYCERRLRQTSESFTSSRVC